MKNILFVFTATLLFSCSKKDNGVTSNKYWHVRYEATANTAGDFSAIYNSKSGQIGESEKFTTSWSYEGDFSKDQGVNNKNLGLNIVGNYNSTNIIVNAKIIVDGKTVAQDIHTADNLSLSFKLQ